MFVSFSPYRPCCDATLTVIKTGETLRINGDDHDFSVIPDGAIIPASAVDSGFLSGNLERIDGVLHITLRLPVGPDPSPGVAFPTPLINPPDGLLPIPSDVSAETIEEPTDG